MPTAAFAEFCSAIKECTDLIKEAIRRKSRLNRSSKLSDQIAFSIALVRKGFLKLIRDYPPDRYKKVSFQLSMIEPLVNEFVSTYPGSPKDMLLLLKEISFKTNSDLLAEIETEAIESSSASEPPFLPDDLIEERHNVHKRTLWEINRTYENACYNSCAAMIRKLAESLIIDAYEHHNLRLLILDQNGEYLALKDLIGKACAQSEFRLTRETKRVLPDLKFFGDLAAHNRSSLVRKHDLDRLHNAARCAIEELYRNI
jgi:hypothetical protein